MLDTYNILDGQKIITDYGISAKGHLVIPNEIEGLPVTSIGDEAFYGCSSLTSITIPNSVTSIGDEALCGCKSLTSITVTSGNELYQSLDGVVFSKDLKELLICPAGKSGHYTIPKGVTSIGDWAFSTCSRLTSITIPDSVTSIGKNAFRWCSRLTSITIPNSVTSIGDEAFWGCSSSSEIKLAEKSVE